jgi:hypothetical protein
MNDKAIVDPKELLQEQIRSMASRTEGGGDIPIIQVTQDKHFIFPGTTEKVQGPFQAVLYDFINVNALYPKPFDRSNKDSEANRPACFAQGYKIEEMAPDPKLVKEPVNDLCHTCPMQEWGSGPNAGRACQNRRKIALRRAHDPNGPTLILSISKTATGPFDKMVRQLAEAQVPLCKVVVDVGFNPDKDFPSILINPVEENPHFEADAQRLPRARQLIEQMPRPKED